MNATSSELVETGVPPAEDSGGRRTRLREFQARLVERMQAVSSGAQAQANLLGVMIGEQRYLLSLQQAGEILTVGAIAEVPLTQPWFLGLMNVRGNLMSVIDFAAFHGETPTEIEKDSRIVAFAPSMSFNCGLLVSRVLGLRNVDEMGPYSSIADGAAPWAARQYLDRDTRIWTELDLSLVAQDPRFLQVGR